MDIFWTIVVILVILWLLGFSLGLVGSLIHILLVVAIIVILVRISWEEYKERFRNEMLSSVARTIMKDIKMLSKDVDVYLICSCHNTESDSHVLAPIS